MFAGVGFFGDMEEKEDDSGLISVLGSEFVSGFVPEIDNEADSGS